MVTGKTYTGSTITVDAPNNQGQVRVLVKDWTGGKLIEDGAFIYETAAQHKGGQTYDGNQEAGTTWVDEAPLQPAKRFSFSRLVEFSCTDTINSYC